MRICVALYIHIDSYVDVYYRIIGQYNSHNFLSALCEIGHLFIWIFNMMWGVPSNIAAHVT